MYFVNNGKILQGCLWFTMNYSPSTSEGVVNPDENTVLLDGLLIEDSYDLSIEFDDVAQKRTARELGGRILHTKNKWRLSWADVHMYKEDYSLCLCPNPEEELMFANGFSLEKYFYHILIPFFYFQSFLSRFGREPWKSTSHGQAGILESYGKQRLTDLPIQQVFDCYKDYLSLPLLKLASVGKKINPEMLCVCGSNKGFLECHPSAFEAFIQLQKDYRYLTNKKSRIR